MTATHESGPAIIYGIPVGASASAGSNPEAGPSVTYQGDCIFDPRFPYNPGITGPGRIKSHLDSPYILLVDSVPAALAAANIAAAQAGTAATPLTLASAVVAGISPKMPILPFGGSAIVTALALDFGFTTGNTTSSSATVSSVGSTAQLYIGMPIAVAGAAGSGAPLLTSVATIVSATSFTMADQASASITGAQIGTLDAGKSYIDPYVTAGAARIFDPTQGLARNVRITSVGNDSGITFKVTGYDIYSQAMTETITGANAAVASGKKAFKGLVSVVPSGNTAANVSVGTGDVYGINLRSDRWEYANFYFNGAFLTANTGWLAADTTNPATSTTGDVRGTYATQSASDGTKRLALFMSIPLYNLINGTPTGVTINGAAGSYATLYGVTQA